MPPKKQKKATNKPDSDDDWQPVDDLGNPIPLADTSGWEDSKIIENKKKQVPHQQKKSTTNRDQRNRHSNDNKLSKSTTSTTVTSNQPTLTSFENKHHTTASAANSANPTTIRTIFAKATEEEKEAQRQLTLIPLPTYDPHTGTFIPEKIKTLQPGLKTIDIVSNSAKETTSPIFNEVVSSQNISISSSADHINSQIAMPVSPLYSKFQLPFPKRPTLNINVKTLTPQQYKSIEQQHFEQYLTMIYDKFSTTNLNHFEHNLYVWKQLWLCCEQSDIILIIIDVRNPLFHFNKYMYQYIIHELKKPFVIVLNKIDLIPIHISIQYKTFLEANYPGVHVVLFSSYPSILHRFVLDLQHNPIEGKNDNETDPNNITLNSLLQHNIDLTPNDIAQHQRSVVTKMKQSSIIDTVGVDELLQLCCKIVLGKDLREFTKTGAAILNTLPNNDVTEDCGSDADNDLLSDRRILSQREKLKFNLKYERSNRQLSELQRSIQEYISHCQTVEQYNAENGENNTTPHYKPSSRSPAQSTYFQDNDALAIDEELEPSSDEEDDELAPPLSKKSQRNTLNNTANKRPQQYIKQLKTDDYDNVIAESSESDHDENSEVDIAHLHQYFPELSMTEDDVDATEFRHITQSSPDLRNGNNNDEYSTKGYSKPVFDFQRIVEHIYSKEDTTREIKSKSKESLLQFEQHMNELNGIPNVSQKGIRLNPRHKRRQRTTDGDHQKKKESDEIDRKQHEIMKQVIPKVRIGVVGHPNVGKSSVVNAIARKKTVSVSRQPGHTKYNQTIKLNDVVSLIDCPGLIFPALDENKASSTLFGLFPIPQLSLPTVVIYYLAQMVDLVGILGLINYHPNLYDTDEHSSNVKKTAANADNINLSWTAMSICEAYAYKRGFMSNKGLPDTQRAAQQILYLVSDGRIQLYMLPPTLEH